MHMRVKRFSLPIPPDFRKPAVVKGLSPRGPGINNRIAYRRQSCPSRKQRRTDYRTRTRITGMPSDGITVYNGTADKRPVIVNHDGMEYSRQNKKAAEDAFHASQRLWWVTAKL